MSIVIIGAGIIGSATAFYLTQEPSTTPADSIHIIESSPELFASASGYAAGFLARDWFSHSAASLGALSFDLHRELAERHGGADKWGYSRSTSTSFTRDPLIHGEDWVESGSRANVASDVQNSQPSHLPNWLKRRENDDLDIVGTDENTAQVDPLRLSRFLLDTAISRGVHLHYPTKALSLSLSKDGTPSSITITDSSSSTSETTTISCTRLIITAGAWTPRVYASLFPSDSSTRIPITQLAGYSLLLRTPLWKAGDELPLPRPPPANQNKNKAHNQIAHISPLSNTGLRTYSASEPSPVSSNISNSPTALTSTPTSKKGGCHAVFTTASGPDRRNDWSPEIFSRAGGEIYIAGLNDPSLPLPEKVTERVMDPVKIEVLKEEARRLVRTRTRTPRGEAGLEKDGGKREDGGANADADEKMETEVELEVLREGLCFRPVTKRGSPIVAEVREHVWLAAGHGPWGISLSLGTGMCVSELIEGRERSAEVGGLGL